MINIESIKAKLKNISKEKEILYQNLLNKLGEERFLARLAISPYSGNLIFKGGSLLPQFIETSRRTRDIDFSIKDLDNSLDNLTQTVKKISAANLSDGFVFNKIKGEVLDHPHLEYSGARIKIEFRFDKIKGSIWMDLARGDNVSPKKHTFKVMRYKDNPLIGEDITLLCYPPEFVFS